jgi:hypothetical protein
VKLNSDHRSAVKLNPVAISEYAAADPTGTVRACAGLSGYGFATVLVWNLPRRQEKMEPPKKGAMRCFCVIPCARFDATLSERLA